MNIGIICSSNGNAPLKVIDILNKIRPDEHQILIVTDRTCGIEKSALGKNISCYRINDGEKKSFSKKAKEYFEKQNIDFIVLFFSKLISEDLFQHIPVFNIHPSLLPGFPGFKALDCAFSKKVKFLGTTLHLVDSEMDNGSIIAQTVFPVALQYTIQDFYKISFLQKVYLFLLLIELMEKDKIAFTKNYSEAYFREPILLEITASCNPALTNEKFLIEFKKLQEKENFRILL